MILLTPDGERYSAMGRGDRVARPFHLRWLLPFLLRDNHRAWAWVTRTSIVALGLLAWWFTGSPWAILLPFGLAGVTRFPWRCPVLVDPAGMALALLSGCLWVHGWRPEAVVVAVLAGTVRETAPIWAAVYAWNPLLLAGLAPVALRALIRQGTDPLGGHNEWIIRHPIKASLEAHRGRWLDPLLMFAPWGVLIIGMAGWSPQMAVAVGLAYVQLFVATDTVRLYQWAWPVLALGVVGHVPAEWLPVVAVAGVFNPWTGDGI